MENSTKSYIDKEYLKMLGNFGIFILKPEINSDKTSLISIDTINNRIEYYRDEKEKYTRISIINNIQDQLLLNIEIYDDSKTVREYQSNDNNEIILELITTGG